MPSTNAPIRKVARVPVNHYIIFTSYIIYICGLLPEGVSHVRESVPFNAWYIYVLYVSITHTGSHTYDSYSLPLSDLGEKG